MKHNSLLAIAILSVAIICSLVIFNFMRFNNTPDYSNDVEWIESASKDLSSRCVQASNYDFDEIDNVITVTVRKNENYDDNVYYSQDIYDMANCMQSYLFESGRDYTKFNVVFNVIPENKKVILTGYHLYYIYNNEFFFPDFMEIYNSAGVLNEE